MDKLPAFSFTANLPNKLTVETIYRILFSPLFSSEQRDKEGKAPLFVAKQHFSAQTIFCPTCSKPMLEAEEGKKSTCILPVCPAVFLVGS